ncbi:hypothetical protein NCLIV_049560 [Neospora caninum Liverpool]|uniref:Transporter, small conductance mechanosensitive ion channel (MscS) family protein n=1 Tax=Neospora caninum (strain Liverpool) TaxID=572307 RepID=F0VKC6_NEOCL|nr:hypothetical protein NCLIV_049560 [Neospora caninum Liverpool]CBZ54527.1 hypothetical protein NCLIV_049560 [Neospora caninum Liverpool]CEL69240.1 TPA: transporter, small conductance mechanosensitive ion channel (MscS) family protein [Neospora caninum Liverpool]|eukprot:XP_003884557.1 hypothetical protein NCLIV_049560 [Neospora caninum Liverpool]
MERMPPQPAGTGDKGPAARPTKNEGAFPSTAAEGTKFSNARREQEEGVERHRLASFNLHASASAFRHLGSRLASLRGAEGSHAGAPPPALEEEKEEPDSDAEDDDTPACIRLCFKSVKTLFPDADPFYWFAFALIACLITVLIGLGDGTSPDQQQYSLGVASPGWKPGDTAEATTKPPEIIEDVNMPTFLSRGGLAFFYVICINIALWLSFMLLRLVVILGVLNFVCYEMQGATAFTATVDPDIFYVIWSVFCYILWLNNSDRTNLVLVAKNTADVQPLMFFIFFGKDLCFPSSSLQIIYICNIVMIILSCRRLLLSLMIFVFELGFLMNMNNQAVAYLSRYSRLRKFNIKWCTFAAQAAAETESCGSETSKFASRLESLAYGSGLQDQGVPAQAPGPFQRGPPQCCPGGSLPEQDAFRPIQRNAFAGEAVEGDAFEKIKQLQEASRKGPKDHFTATRSGLRHSGESLREGKTLLRAATQGKEHGVKHLRIRHAATEKRLRDEFGTANLPRQLHPKYIEKSKTSKIRNWLLIHYVYDYAPAMFVRSERIELVHKPVAKQVADLLFKEIIRDQSELEAAKMSLAPYNPLPPTAASENPNADCPDASGFKDLADPQNGQPPDLVYAASPLPPGFGESLNVGPEVAPVVQALCGNLQPESEDAALQSLPTSTGPSPSPPPASSPQPSGSEPPNLEAKPAEKASTEHSALGEARAPAPASSPVAGSEGDGKAQAPPGPTSLTPPATVVCQREAPRTPGGNDADPRKRGLAKGATAALSLLQAQDSEEFEPLEGDFDFRVLDKQTASLPEHLRTKHFETHTPFSISVSPDQADVAEHLSREAAAQSPEATLEHRGKDGHDGDRRQTRLEVGPPTPVTESRPPFSAFAQFFSSPSHQRAFDGDASSGGMTRGVSGARAPALSSPPAKRGADARGARPCGLRSWVATNRRVRQPRTSTSPERSEVECLRVICKGDSDASLSGFDSEAESSDAESKQERMWLQRGSWRTRKSWAETLGSHAKFSHSEDSEASRESNEEKKASELLLRPYLFQARQSTQRGAPLAALSAETEPSQVPHTPRATRRMARHRTVDLPQESCDEDLAAVRRRRGDVELVPRNRMVEERRRQQPKRNASSPQAYRVSATHGFELPALFGSAAPAAADPAKNGPQPGPAAPLGLDGAEAADVPSGAPGEAAAATARWAPETLPPAAPVVTPTVAPANPGNFLSPNAVIDGEFLKPRVRSNAVFCPTGLDLPAQEEKEEVAVTREYIDLFLKPEEADELMKDVDLAGHGKFNDAMFRRAVVILYSMRKKLLKSLKSQASIASTVSRMISVLLWVVSFIILLLVLGVNINTVIVSGAACLSAIIVALSYFYQNFVTAVLFIAVSNPFNVGDRVRIDGGEILYVRKIRTYTTEFETAHGRPMFFSNAVLFNRVITNESRSKNSCFEIPLVLDIRTPESSIRQLQASMQRYMESRSLEFVKDTFRMFVTNVQPGRQIDIAFWMTCVEGWGNFLKVLRTRTDVYFYLLKQLARLHISFQLPLQPIHFPSSASQGGGNPPGRLAPSSTPQERKVVSAGAATQQFQTSPTHGKSLPLCLASSAWGDGCLQPEVSPFSSSPFAVEAWPGVDCIRVSSPLDPAPCRGDAKAARRKGQRLWERAGELASGVYASATASAARAASCVGLRGDGGDSWGERARRERGRESGPLDREVRRWGSKWVAARASTRLRERRTFREDQKAETSLRSASSEEESRLLEDREDLPAVSRQRVSVSGLQRGRRSREKETVRRRRPMQGRESRAASPSSQSPARLGWGKRERQALLP